MAATVNAIMRNVKVILVDLSGTLHIEDAVIPGSIEALTRLRNTNVKVKFVTNTTKESKDTLFNRLAAIGFNIGHDEIYTSLSAARHVVVKENLRPFYLLSDDALKDFQGIPTDNSNAVVVGLAPSMFDYENLTKAFRLLIDGASLIAIHKSRYYRRKDGLALGPGAFVSALEYSTGVTAKVVGKPEASFFLSALEEFECSKDEAIMIGDDARDDVQGAMKAGLKAVLVKTGKYRPGDEDALDPPPTFVADNFAQAVEKIIAEYLST